MGGGGACRFPLSFQSIPDVGLMGPGECICQGLQAGGREGDTKPSPEASLGTALTAVLALNPSGNTDMSQLCVSVDEPSQEMMC